MGIHPVRKSKESDKTAARSCKFCGYKHQFTRPSRYPAFGKQCLKYKKEGHFAQVCPANVKEGSKVDLVQQESPPDLDTKCVNKEVHTSSLLRLKGRMLKSKQTQVQRLLSFPIICIRKSPKNLSRRSNSH